MAQLLLVLFFNDIFYYNMIPSVSLTIFIIFQSESRREMASRFDSSLSV